MLIWTRTSFTPLFSCVLIIDLLVLLVTSAESMERNVPLGWPQSLESTGNDFLPNHGCNFCGIMTVQNKAAAIFKRDYVEGKQVKFGMIVHVS